MKPSLLFFSVVFLSSKVFNIDPSEYCLNKNRECKGLYNRARVYSVKCEQLKCAGIHSHSCENEYCSTSKKTCSNLLLINKIIRSISAYNLQEKALQKYNSFIQNLTVCPAVKYELKEDDICLNTRSCMYVESHVTDEMGKKHLVCPCFGKTAFHCDTRYCASQSRACDAIKANTTIRSIQNRL